MKSTAKHASRFVYILALAGLMFVAVPRVTAQQDAPTIIGDADDKFNPAPCDFSDTFYGDNGIDVTVLNQSRAGRFGTFRQFGPPARTPGQANWVADSVNCAAKDPTRRNFRILATTAGYVDDGTSSPTDFISLIAFLFDETFFETDYSRSVGGSTISIANSLNPRGHSTEEMVGHFEAYAANKQFVNGVFKPQPCLASIGQTTNCFPVDSVATPTLRQDWRFASNRNSMDGSNGNCVNPDPNVCDNGASPPDPITTDSPFGYFCDDLLGMWIITYFYYTDTGFGPNQTAQCQQQLAGITAVNGLSLDGTPIVTTADQLNNQLEAFGCGAEFQEDVGGGDHGPVWLICPAIPDPRAGAIALDAFLDSVHKPNGAPLDIHFTINFLSLKIFGVFPNELTSSQQSQLSSAVAAAN